MKYKVGDRVKIIKSIGTCNQAFNHIGKTSVITEVRDRFGEDCYSLEIDDGVFNWFNRELELAEKTLETLEVGDRVSQVGSCGDILEVLAVIHRNSEKTVYAISDDIDDDEENEKICEYVFTAFDLKKRGYVVQKTECVENFLEITKEEVFKILAKEKGVSSEKIRIKE